MSRAIIRGRLYFALYLDPILRCSPLTPSPGLTHCSNRTNNFFLLSFFPLLFFERTVSLRYPLISNSSRSLFREIRRLDGRLCVTSSCCEEQFWGREVMIIRGREEGVSYRIGRLINVALRSFIRYHIRHFLSFEGWHVQRVWPCDAGRLYGVVLNEYSFSFKCYAYPGRVLLFWDSCTITYQEKWFKSSKFNFSQIFLCISLNLFKLVKIK